MSIVAAHRKFNTISWNTMTAFFSFSNKTILWWITTSYYVYLTPESLKFIYYHNTVYSWFITVEYKTILNFVFRLWTHKRHPYLSIMGKIWDVFSESFGEKTPWDIESALFCHINLGLVQSGIGVSSLSEILVPIWARFVNSHGS